MKCFNGLSTVNVELSNRCQKRCWCCGRRKLEKDYPDLCNWGDIDFKLVKSIAKQLPEGIVVQFHANGESLLYPKFGEAVKLFKNQIKCLDTNGKLLLEKSDQIIDNLDTLTISVIENDPEGDEQYEIVKKFLKIKGNRKPFMVYRLLGKIMKKDRWYKLPGIVATRVLHSPMGSFNYKKKVTIPEIGICLEALNHLVINRDGTVSLCVRFDPLKELVIGNANKEKLIDIWNGKKRLSILKKHIEGKRSELPYCGKKCDYWGCPTGY
jgi:radical SAM protein with 4Fe4S-binding SPASM domain